MLKLIAGAIVTGHLKNVDCKRATFKARLIQGCTREI